MTKKKAKTKDDGVYHRIMIVTGDKGCYPIESHNLSLHPAERWPRERLICDIKGDDDHMAAFASAIRSILDAYSAVKNDHAQMKQKLENFKRGLKGIQDA